MRLTKAAAGLGVVLVVSLLAGCRSTTGSRNTALSQPPMLGQKPAAAPPRTLNADVIQASASIPAGETGVVPAVATSSWLSGTNCNH